MKKIPTLFEREFNKAHGIVAIRPNVTPGMEWVIDGEGTATIKIDGSCCAIIDGVFYKRYDAKRGRTPPENAIPCCDPDPVTGHWPHWVPVDKKNPGDKWFVVAQQHSGIATDGTYEAIGPHFCGNPYRLDVDIIERHGTRVLTDVPRDFDGIREYLRTHAIEGIVFWKDGMPQCKIKRSDYGYKWPIV